MIEAISEFLRDKFGLYNQRITDRLNDKNERIGYDLYIKEYEPFYNWLYRHNDEIRIEEKYLRQF